MRQPIWHLVGGLLVIAVACTHPLPPPAPVAVKPPAELVVVLPEPSGAVGALTVVIGGAEQALTQPYSAVRTSPEGRVDTTPPSPAEVRAIFGPAVAARPGRPTTYWLYFVVNTDTLTAASASSLPTILTEIARTPAPEVMVIGHADRSGTERENDLLSIKRAERIRQDLLRQGVAADAVETVGRGAREATGNAAQDRRVEIVVR